MAELIHDRTDFATVSGGKIRKTRIAGKIVDSETPKAVLRKVTNPKTNEAIEKWEMVIDGWVGKITNVYFKEDNEFGDRWIVTMKDGDEEVNLTIKYKSKYFVTFMCRLMNVNLDDRVEFKPYQFKGEKDQNITGITLRQLKGVNWEKVDSFYHETTGKESKVIKGFPVFDDTYTKDNWDAHMIRVRNFLKDEFNSRLKSKFESMEKDSIPTPEPEDDLPF